MGREPGLIGGRMGWVAREERAGGGSSIRVGSGRKRGK